MIVFSHVHTFPDKDGETSASDTAVGLLHVRRVVDKRPAERGVQLEASGLYVPQ